MVGERAEGVLALSPKFDFLHRTKAILIPSGYTTCLEVPTTYLLWPVGVDSLV